MLYITAGVVAVSFLVVLAVLLLRYAFVALLPFIIAVIFALMMEPPVRLLSRKMPRGLAVFLTMTIFFAAAGFTLTVLVSHLVTELGDLSGRLPVYIGEFQQMLTFLVTWIRDSYGALPPQAVEYLENAITAVTTSAGDSITIVISSFLSLLGSLPNAALVLVVSILATFFISRDRRVLGRFWVHTVPEPWGQHTLFFGREAFTAFLAYVRAQFILVMFTMFLATAGLYLLKVKYALTLGLLIGFFDVIPVLGPSAVFIPWIILAFVTGAKTFAVKLLILYVAVFVMRQLFEARIVALSLGLHPLAVMVGMYAGLKILGVAGLVLGPIVVILIQAAYKAGLASFRGKTV